MIVKRDLVIDILKAYAILLVVLGHCIQFTYINFDDNYIFKLIYSFHMPLFFFLSGYVTYITNVRDKLSFTFIIKKFKYLVIPYITFLFIDFLFGKNLEFSTILYHIDIGYWFLPVLFMIFLIFYLYYLFNSYSKYLSYLFVLLIIVLPLTKLLGFHLVKWYLIFFLLGYIINKDMNLILKNKLLNILNLFLFLILIFFWQRTGDNILYIYGIKFISALSGILFSFYLISKLQDFIKDYKIIQYIGLNTFGIYVLHFYGFSLVKYDIALWQLLILKFISAIIFSLILIYIINKTKVFKFLIGSK